MTMTSRLCRLAALLACLVAAHPAFADPALWEVTAPGARVYLFGTVHALRKGMDWETPAVASALASSQVLYLEVANADDQAALMPLVMKLGMDPRHKLSDLLGEGDRKRLAAAMNSFPGGAAAIDMMRPWMAAVALAVVPVLRQGYDPNNGVEEALKAQARQHGTPINGLETLDQQTHILADMPQPMALAFLRSSLDDLDKGGSELAALVAAWQSGDVTRQFALETDDLRSAPAGLYDRLITTRNRNWAGQIAAILRTGHGTSFVAVGAAHLAGPLGVTSLLQTSGFNVRRVEHAG